MDIDFKEIKEQAEAELKAEELRAAVDAYKIKLKSKKWYHCLFPYKIVFIRRE